MNGKVVTLDVREDLRRGREPFSRIMQAVAMLSDEEELLLIAPMEPVPLYAVLARQGFAHEPRSTAKGDWEVRFTRDPSKSAREPALPPTAPVAREPQPGACAGSPVLELDARGLEPPQPLVKILEALSTLPAGAQLRARTDRRPMHLYARLEERGFAAESEQQADGSFITNVHRR